MGSYGDWYRREAARGGDPVEGALSPEDWAEMRCRAADGEARVEPDGTLRVEGAFRAGERRGLAALALHGETLGFTWEDVDFIRSASLADDLHSPDDWFILQRLGRRIAALLPPREPEPLDG